MKSLSFILVVLCCIYKIESFRSGVMVVPKSYSNDPVTMNHFDQILDHFDNSSTTFWKQRCYMNDKYWGGGNSPVFLLIGGESDATPDFLRQSFMVQMAVKYKALMLHLEHRFYGESHPTEDASTENMKKYLTSQQALGDLAYFIEKWNEGNNLTSENKWILYGGSYPGNLVAWARLKYPHLVYGGISSSGPLQAKSDFYDYNNVLRASLNYFHPGCADEVTNSIHKLKEVFESEDKLKEFKEKLPLCGYTQFNPKDKFDVALYVQILTNPVASGVQNNMIIESNGIDNICKYMQDTSTADPLDRLINLFKSLGNSCGVGDYSLNVKRYSETAWNSSIVSSASRQWWFQTCNEFGYYQTSEYSNSFFLDTVPLEYSTKFCTDVFGPEFNPEQQEAAIAATNQYYGGTKIQVDRVVFIYGSVDPWWPLGVIENPTNESPYYFVEGTSHCYDMLSPLPSDPPSLTAARNGADQYLNHWLNA